jgi:gluconolactonase
MRTKARWISAIVFLFVLTGLGQSQAAAQSVQGQPPYVGPATETTAPNIPGVVKGGTQIKVLKEGFKSTEGPMGTPDGGLLFTSGDMIYKIDLNGNSSVYLEDTKGANGLGLDPKGRLIAAQDKGIGVLMPKGQETTLTDNFEGKPFLRPNDITVDKKGGVYFTDFIFTPPGKPYVPAPGSLPPAVYYMQPGGKTIKVDEYRRPNGIILSPDERRRSTSTATTRTCSPTM